MRNLIDPRPLRAFVEQQERTMNLVDPAMLKLLDERNAIERAVDSSFIHPLLEAESSARRIMQDIAESLTAANVAISHSVFSTDFLEGIRKIAAEHEVAKMKIDAAIAQVAKQFKPIPLYADVEKLADLFKPIDLTGFYQNFKHIEEMSRAAQSVLGTVRLDSLGDLIGVVDPAELQLGTIRLNKSYARFAASAAAAPDSIIEAPFMAKIPALAVYSHARVMRSITTHGADEPVIEIWSEVQVETTEIIETTLPLVNPALLKSWKGGLATVRTQRR